MKKLITIGLLASTSVVCAGPIVFPYYTEETSHGPEYCTDLGGTIGWILAYEKVCELPPKTSNKLFKIYNAKSCEDEKNYIGGLRLYVPEEREKLIEVASRLMYSAKNGNGIGEKFCSPEIKREQTKSMYRFIVEE